MCRRRPRIEPDRRPFRYSAEPHATHLSPVFCGWQRWRLLRLVAVRALRQGFRSPLRVQQPGIERFDSSHLAEQVVSGDPRIAQRLQLQSQVLTPQQNDPRLRQALIVQPLGTVALGFAVSSPAGGLASQFRRPRPRYGIAPGSCQSGRTQETALGTAVRRAVRIRSDAGGTCRRPAAARYRPRPTDTARAPRRAPAGRCPATARPSRCRHPRNPTG